MATILVVSAHPDDETMAAGGTIAMYAAQGDTVYLLETTRGEGGEVGDPALTEREHLGQFRVAETEAAAQILGVHEVRWLPFEDPYMEIGGTARRIDVALDVFVAAIAAELTAIRPDTVITHGSQGEYGHPQHIFTYQATLLAIGATDLRPEVLTWGAWYADAERPRMLNRNDPAQIVRDISPWYEQKVAAAMAHRTQHAMFLRNTGAASVADMVTRIESFSVVKHGG